MPPVMKVFASPTSDASPTVSFQITLTNPQGEQKTLEFAAYTDPPADGLIIMGRMMRVSKAGEQFIDSSLLAEALDRIIVNEDRGRWQAEVMENRYWMVPSSVLADVFMWLQETVWDRPTGPSSGSSTTQSDNGAGSTANAPSTTSTLPAS